MANPLNAAKGAALIEAQTGRRCTRQNLEKLCDRGALKGSPCILQAKPLRVDGDLLVAEYLARVAPHQAEAQQPRAKREAPSPPAGRAPTQLPPDAPDELPDYTISRARSEFEKANLLELERKQKEGSLLAREDVERAWANTVSKVKSRILATASAAKQRIPHLEPEEVEVLKDMLREALFELAAEGRE
jgi:hypothetical protein